MITTQRRFLSKGFTLIELLVVIAIIGILSSVVLASLGTAREKARDATRISDMKNMQTALALYYDSRQGYPGQVLTTTYDATTLFTDVAWTTSPFVGAGAFLPNFPTDPVPARAAEYVYAYTGVDATGTAPCFGAFVGSEPVACEGYLVGASLERADSVVLGGDSDATIGAVSGSDVGTCGDVAITAAFCYALVP